MILCFKRKKTSINQNIQTTKLPKYNIHDETAVCGNPEMKHMFQSFPIHLLYTRSENKVSRILHQEYFVYFYWRRRPRLCSVFKDLLSNLNQSSSKSHSCQKLWAWELEKGNVRKCWIVRKVVFLAKSDWNPLELTCLSIHNLSDELVGLGRQSVHMYTVLPLCQVSPA